MIHVYHALFWGLPRRAISLFCHHFIISHLSSGMWTRVSKVRFVFVLLPFASLDINIIININTVILILVWLCIKVINSIARTIKSSAFFGLLVIACHIHDC